jgi:hypothetical protein
MEGRRVLSVIQVHERYEGRRILSEFVGYFRYRSVGGALKNEGLPWEGKP